MEKVKTFKAKCCFPIILMIGFIDYLGIGFVYPLFAALLFDSNQSNYSSRRFKCIQGRDARITNGFDPA